MSIVVVTGSAGLIGSEAVKKYTDLGFTVVGIDNNQRKVFFGEDACTLWNRERLKKHHANYVHYDIDIRNSEDVNKIFEKYKNEISLIIHTAAQPSHDWASSDPHTDFTVNANGTLVLLEAFRKFAPHAVFIFTSTNKVYGDRPNSLEISELASRFEVHSDEYIDGIDESMSIDQCKHSIFGTSKVAADVLVQEYGKYFSLQTGVFRGGCLTGPSHSGTKLHGFLSYMMRCAIACHKYTIIGYKGKQVRDNIHSADLIEAFHQYYLNPKMGEVYNIGGGRFSNCSVIEAIEHCEAVTGKKMQIEYVDSARSGDHIWWISNLNKFKSHYPGWNVKHNVLDILNQIYETQKDIKFQ